MWGLHDHNLILRTALHRLLTKGVEREGVKRRWKYQTQLRNDEAGGLTFTEEEWEFEWGEILRIATNKPRRQPITDSLRRHSSLRLSYESLEEIHISVLAHTLRRPIIVISDRTIKDMSGQDLAPIYFGGIYLPLEVNPTACYKSPIVLAYDSSHFSPLVALQESPSSEQGSKQQPRPPKYARMSSRKETVIPLVSPDGCLLPVQFIYDPKKRNVQEKWSKMEYEVGEFPDEIVSLLESYMNVRWIQLNVAASDAGRSEEDYDHLFPVKVPKVRFPAASIAQEAQPIYQKELMEKYLNHIRVKFQEEKDARARREAQREEEERRRLQNIIVPCEGEGCDMFGRPATNNLCSVCYQKALLAAKWEGEDARLAEASMTGEEEEADLSDLHRGLDPTMRMPQERSPKRRVHFDPPPDQLDGQREEHVFGSDDLDPPTYYHSNNHGSSNPQSQQRNVISSQKEVITTQPLPLPKKLPQTNTPRDAETAPKQPPVPPRQALAPKQTNVQRDTDDLQQQQRAAPKQPMIPPRQPLAPKLTNIQVDHVGSSRDQQGHGPDKNRPSSHSPTPPNGPSPSHHSKSPTDLPIPSKKLGSPTKGATPISPVKSKAAPPPKSGKGSQSSSGAASAGQASKSSNWVSNLLFKKKTSPSRGYSRDNILPLHLEQPQAPTEPEVLDKVGVAGSGDARVTVKEVNKKCKTVNCDFYGSASRAGYCSSCYEVISKVTDV